MAEARLWSLEQFPMIYEGGQPKAVLIDLETFKRLEFLLDNLLNREPESEDDMLAESAELKQLVEQVKAAAVPTLNWKQELDEL
jgi:PHD/YefM family antitoxin component YafN of YafNO toxin-antitoxin module